jgi:o-succinylbenzoate---CoA ligase
MKLLMSEWFAQTFSIPRSSYHHGALVYDHQILTYQELSGQIDRLTVQFRAQGLTHQDRAAFIAHSTLSSILTFFALLQIGASVCPLNFRLPPEQLQERLKQARISHFIDTSSGALHRIGPTPPSYFPSSILMFSSGSQGMPKIAVLSIDNFLYNAQGSLDHLKLEPCKCTWLLSLPLFHVSGLSILFRCFLSANTVLIPNKPLQDMLENQSFSHVSLVHTQLFRWIRQQKEKFSVSLQCVLLGGAPISQALFQQAMRKRLPLFPTYGMTEMASQITTAAYDPDTSILHLGSPLPCREIKIADNGEILVKGRTLFHGYVSENGLDLPIDQEGWFDTKDLGEWSNEGFLLFKGRKDNLFISGGENLYPEEIERALCELPDVLQSVVVPIEDEEFGQRPVAFVLMDGPFKGQDTFLERLKEKLPKYAIPLAIYPFPEDFDMNVMKWNRSYWKQRARNLTQKTT